MIDLFEAARELQEFCDRNGRRSCFIGGLAVQRWGEPRVTRDVDLTVMAGFGNEERIIDPLLDKYVARIEDAREYALRRRVLLLAAPGGAGIDVLLGALPYEENLVNRATPFTFSMGHEVRTCAEGVAIRNRGRLDWGYIREQLEPLAEVKQDPEILKTMVQLQEI